MLSRCKESFFGKRSLWLYICQTEQYTDNMATLFVVDDNDIDNRILKYNLDKVNLFTDVVYFNMGIPLINYITKNQHNRKNLPDAIFLDLNMPEFDGIEVLNALKAIYGKLSKKITVYILSASLLPKRINKTREYHFVRKFITKPITQASLLAVAQELQCES